MKYISTHGNSPAVSLYEAILHSSAPDGGVYIPETLPLLPEAFFNNVIEMSPAEIAYVLADRLFGDILDSSTLKTIVDSSINFPIITKNIAPDIHVLELFHGPTLAFKDFGAAFMARFVEHSPALAPGRKLDIIVSTSGNTGSAIANAFAGISRAEVFILFPPNSCNRSLERQFTTLGGNIHPIEVQGTIDDCYRLARQALSDKSLNTSREIVSANSTNILRLLPQTFYYFIGMAQLAAKGIYPRNVVISLPCGNFGNLCGAVMAQRMGLPMKRIVACENANCTLAHAFETGRFERRSSIPTLAYATDKGRPSNHERLMRIFNNDTDAMRRLIVPHVADDRTIIDTVNSCLEENRYLLDPHSAMAYDGIRKNLSKGETGLVICTAHPAKSVATMAAITGRALDLPLQLNAFMGGRDHRVRIAPDYKEFKSLLKAIRK